MHDRISSIHKRRRLIKSGRHLRLPGETSECNPANERLFRHYSKTGDPPNKIRVSQRNETLTRRIRRARYRSVTDAQDTTLFQKKKTAEARLNSTKKRLWVKLIAQARERNFQTAATLTFDAQFSATAVSSPSTQDIQHAQKIVYNTAERAEVVRLICDFGGGLKDREEFRRRIRATEARTALCHRR